MRAHAMWPNVTAIVQRCLVASFVSVQIIAEGGNWAAIARVAVATGAALVLVSTWNVIRISANVLRIE